MSARLERAIDDVTKLERKLMQYQQQKKVALTRLKQVENEEIVKTVRSLKLDRKGLLELLDGIADGSITLDKISKADDGENGNEETVEGQSILDKEPDSDQPSINEKESEEDNEKETA